MYIPHETRSKETQSQDGNIFEREYFQNVQSYTPSPHNFPMYIFSVLISHRNKNDECGVDVCLLSADQALVQLGTQLTSQARFPVKIKPFLKYKEKGLRAFSQDGRRDQLEELPL